MSDPEMLRSLQKWPIRSTNTRWRDFLALFVYRTPMPRVLGGSYGRGTPVVMFVLSADWVDHPGDLALFDPPPRLAPGTRN